MGLIGRVAEVDAAAQRTRLAGGAAAPASCQGQVAPSSSGRGGGGRIGEQQRRFGGREEQGVPVLLEPAAAAAQRDRPGRARPRPHQGRRRAPRSSSRNGAASSWGAGDTVKKGSFACPCRGRFDLFDAEEPAPARAWAGACTCSQASGDSDVLGPERPGLALHRPRGIDRAAGLSCPRRRSRHRASRSGCIGRRPAARIAPGELLDRLGAEPRPAAQSRRDRPTRSRAHPVQQAPQRRARERQPFLIPGRVFWPLGRFRTHGICSSTFRRNQSSSAPSPEQATWV